VGLCRGRSRLAVRGLREGHSMVVDGQLRSNPERKSVAGCGGWEGKAQIVWLMLNFNIQQT
jgi:hypothetical protein